MTIRTFETPLAFKTSLETRLKNGASSGADFARQRQLLIFDRFLARVVAVFEEAVVLKGGLVLELRLGRARTTKDVDLRVSGDATRILAQMQDAARLDLDDFLSFEVVRDAKHPDIQNDGMPYDGQRFKATCRLAGQVYGNTFGVDVAFGDPLIEQPDVKLAKDVLDFVGVPPPKLRIYPVATHIAEKLHAYTMPRVKLNSRVKDLPDIALLASAGPISSGALRTSIERTFEYRGTHSVPEQLPSPPAEWDVAYRRLAQSDELSWLTLEEVTAAVEVFLNPILRNGPSTTKWDVTGWRWLFHE